MSDREDTTTTKTKPLSAKQFHVLFERFPFSMQIFSPDGLMVYANAAWEQLWGFPKKAAMYKYNILKDPQLVEKGSMPYITKAFNGTFAEIPAIIYELEKTIPPVDSTLVRWVKAYIYPIKDDHGNILQVVLMHQDITEHKLSEDELQYQKSVLEAQKEASPDGILLVSPEGRIISYNQRFADMWSFPEGVLASKLDEMALQAAKDQLIDPDTFLKRVESVYRNPRKCHDRLSFIDGRIFDRYGSPIRGKNKSYYGYVWFFRDITAEVQMEKRKDDFISIASHELKTPLTSVTAFAQLLERYLDTKHDTKGTDYISKMTRQLMRLTTLIDDLLDVSKIESGKLVLDRKKIRLNTIITETLAEIAPTITTHSISVTGTTKAYVHADEFRLSQVITNLLTNAVKYSPHAHEVLIHIESDKEKVYVSVQDFGVGIPHKNLDHIFDRFYRVEGRTRNSYPGLGLGLFISSQIIKRHNGNMWVTSKKGDGSTFYFSLPIAP